VALGPECPLFELDRNLNNIGVRSFVLTGAPFPYLVMMLMTANKSIMGRFEIHGYLKYVGWIATAVMAAASAVMFISAFLGGVA
jgi:Mn2+/Fe2+ NRAMP family transporter